MKNIRSDFTPAFFKHPNPSVVEQAQAQEVSSSSSMLIKQARINMPKPQRNKDGAKLSQGASGYANLIDDIIKFVESHANSLQPPLSQHTVSETRKHFSELKSHLFDDHKDFFSSHKAIMFGHVKENFNEFFALLQNQKIPLQKRMTAIVAMAPSMSLCSGGIGTALQDGISNLKHTHDGLKSASYRFKIQIINAVIAEHVSTIHACLPGNEIHFGNAYFNRIADEMGLKPRADAFIKSIEREISHEQFSACKRRILEKLTPSRLTASMADDYLSKITDAVMAIGVDTNKTIEGANLTAAFNATKNVAAATLDAEFGLVPFENFMIPDTQHYGYHLAKQPTLIARHFMEQLGSDKLVDYGDVVRLTKGDEAIGDIMLLDDLLWINQQGACREMTLQELLSASPIDILDNLRNQDVDDHQCFVILQNIVQHVLDIDSVKACDDVLEKWLNAFADIYSNTDALDKNWVTPIFLLAAKTDSVDALKTLISADVDLSLKNSEGHTALMIATGYGSLGALQCLIDGGASVEVADESGATAIMFAAMLGKEDVMKLLLDNGANFDAIHPTNLNPILLAVLKHEVSALQLLVNVGADLEHRNNLYHTALMEAVCSGDVASTEILIRGGALINACNAENWTPAMLAVKNGKDEALKLLIENDANLSCFNNDGKTIIDIAEEYGHAKMLQTVLKEKAKDVKHLFSAIQNGDDVKLQLLIDAGADIECKDNDGQTLAIQAAIAAKNDNIGALRTLIKAKARLNEQDDNGKTALIHATINNNIEALKMLLEAGADQSIVDSSSTNATMHAIGNFHGDALEILFNADNKFGMDTNAATSPTF